MNSDSLTYNKELSLWYNQGQSDSFLLYDSIGGIDMKIVMLDKKTLGDDCDLSELQKMGDFIAYDETDKNHTIDHDQCSNNATNQTNNQRSKQCILHEVKV